MRNLLVKSLIGSSVLVFGLGLQAQAAPQRFDPYNDRADIQDFDNAQSLFHQVRSDIDRAQENAIPSDTSSFERARGELSELQRQWDENVYSPRQADTVISTLHQVLEENRLLPRDRTLAEDLGRMRDFLDSHQ